MKSPRKRNTHVGRFVAAEVVASFVMLKLMDLYWECRIDSMNARECLCVNMGF